VDECPVGQEPTSTDSETSEFQAHNVCVAVVFIAIRHVCIGSSGMGSSSSRIGLLHGVSCSDADCVYLLLESLAQLLLFEDEVPPNGYSDHGDDAGDDGSELDVNE